MKRLTVRVLRGIGAALAEYGAGLDSDEHRAKELGDFAIADRWYREACTRAGWERVYPHLRGKL